MHRSLAALLLLSACGAAPGGSPDDLELPLDPVTRFAGELHLHQFPAGAHAWAGFVAEPVPAANVHSDQLYQLDTAVTASEGACRLWRKPVCSRGCGAGTYCSANDTCTPFAPLTYVDGGRLRISGSRLHDPIELWFGGTDTGYLADPPPGDAPLFAGGELLRIRGGNGPLQLAGALSAPVPLVLESPPPDQPLRLPSSGGLRVQWVAGDAAVVVVTVSASTPEGDWGTLRCVGPDSGQLPVPPSLMEGLPPPPRRTRVEVERDNELILKTVTPGLGLLSHAAFSAWMNGSDP